MQAARRLHATTARSLAFRRGAPGNPSPRGSAPSFAWTFSTLAPLQAEAPRPASLRGFPRAGEATAAAAARDLASWRREAAAQRLLWKRRAPLTPAGGGRLVLNHSLMLEGLRGVLDVLVKHAGISKLVPARMKHCKKVARVLTLHISKQPVRSGFKVIARAGSQLQDVYVTTLMAQAALEALLEASLPAEVRRATAKHAGGAARRAARPVVAARARRQWRTVTYTVPKWGMRAWYTRRWPAGLREKLLLSGSRRIRFEVEVELPALEPPPPAAAARTELTRLLGEPRRPRGSADDPAVAPDEPAVAPDKPAVSPDEPP
ncbi:hypothetical protein M885DRAFT_539082 [Pelagophyceae sp. CCMP2097]|nr:hypothetical protein M885DRAFT_539082 [Pelagophyceae sp. CCMP2097]